MANASGGTVDLHCHTSASMGAVGMPPAVAGYFRRKGYQAFSLTEHNNVDSLIVARDVAHETGIEFIPGIELSVHAEHPVLKSNMVHLLGYELELTGQLTDFCENLTQATEDALEEFLARLFATGIADVGEEDLREEAKARCGEYDSWKRPISTDIIGSVLVRQGVLPEDGSRTVQQLFADICPDLREQLLPSLSDGLEALRAADAVVVLAHPLGTASKGVPPDLQQRLEPWLEQYVDGLEVYYSTYNASERAALLETVRGMNRPFTGGSDTHVFDRADRIRQSDAPYACVESLREFRSTGSVQQHPDPPA
jgi:predicted metal-dependent phosphoesterase TrpH